MAGRINPPYYLSAYGLAVKRGYKGTLDEWLASLKGVKGDPGDEIELRYLDDKIQWRWVPPEGFEAAEDPDGAVGSNQYQWKDLVTLAEIRGTIVEQTIDTVNAKASKAAAMATRAVNAAAAAEGFAKAAEDAAASINDELGGAVEQLIQEVADLKYVPISITSVTASPATAEVGSTVKSLTISWAVNKAPTSQTVDGLLVPAAARSKLFEDVTADKTVNVAATDERGATSTKGATIRFYPGLYYGALEYGSTIDSAAILGLTKTLKSSRTLDFTVNAGGKRPVYALPARYGTPTFKIGGFTYEWEKIATLDFENAHGHTESYTVWMHGQNVSGSITVNVT